MALQAYPDVPLFRYPYTDLSEAQVAAALAAPARVGPGGKGPLDTTSRARFSLSPETAARSSAGRSARATG